MFLEKLNIRGFGCLRTTVGFEPDKLNLVVADNETGKSTLVAAILASFYGIREDDFLATDKRPLREKVLPWSNPEEFGLSLDFAAAGKLWRIDRDFNASTVTLIDRETQKDHTSEYRRPHGELEIGEELIGLSCPNFLKSFYLRQEEILNIRDAGGLTPHVQRVATAREGQATSEHAIGRLKDALRRYTAPGLASPTSIEAAVRQFENERISLKEQLDELDRARNNVETNANELQNSDKKLAILQAKKEKLDLYSISAEVKELERTVQRQMSLRAELDSIKQEVAELDQYKNFPVEKMELLLRETSRIEDINSAISKIKQRLDVDIITRLKRLEVERQRYGELMRSNDVDLRALEAAIERHSDRRDRLVRADEEVRGLEARLKQRKIELSRLNKIRNKFGKLDAEKRRFLEEFRAVYAEAEANFKEAVSQTGWKLREKDILDQKRKQSKFHFSVQFSISAAAFIIGIILLFALHLDEIGKFLIGGGLVMMAAFGFTRVFNSTPDAVRSEQLKNEIEDGENSEHKAKINLDHLSAKLSDIASRLKFTNGDELFAAYMDYIKAQEVIEPLAQAERILSQAHEDELEAAQNLSPFFERAGVDMPKNFILEEAEQLLKRYQTASQTDDEYRQLMKKRQEFEADIAGLEKERNEILGSVVATLSLAEISETDEMENAVEIFRNGRDNHQRYFSLISEIMPRIQQEMITDNDLESKRDRAEMLRSQFDALRKGYKETFDADKPREHYRDLTDEIDSEMDVLIDNRQHTQTSIAAQYSQFQSQYPNILQRIEEIDREIFKAKKFQTEVDLALQTMNDISREVYRSWAKALSEISTPILQSLNPRYRDLIFSEDLRFTIYDRDHDRILSSDEIDMILSSGARDEVFLAARLGIAGYLSQGAKGALPVVLDEPLVTADDAKFLNGMRFFMNSLSQKHQVLIMSCHEKRHEWLEEKEPAMFRERVHNVVLKNRGNA